MKEKKEEKALIDDFSDADEVSNSVNLWDYNEQKEIYGVVSDIEKGNFSERQIILKNQNEELIVLPELTTLNSKLKNAIVGSKIKIVYLGEKKSDKSGRIYKDFKVFMK